MKNINFNYAATSVKKPQVSIDAMIAYLSANDFSSPARGGEASLKEGRIELEARIALSKLFSCKKIENIVFTPNVTTALNMIILGLFEKGCHIITTSVEHNAVSRPLERLKNSGLIELSYLNVEKGNILDTDELKKTIKPNTKMIVMTHASNVTGAILPVHECAKIAKDNGILFVLDAAQSAGIIDIDFDSSDIDILAFTGHKSLMGPSGTGGFMVKTNIVPLIEPIITGGTGSMSHLLTQPEFMPDKFEPGTPNMLGILGLRASVEYIYEIGVNNIFAHELKLTKMFMEGIKNDKVIIYGPDAQSMRTPVVSFNIKGIDNGILGEMLYDNYGISTRSGLHCSPLAHKSMGTYPEGALRASFGYFTTEEEIHYAVNAINEIVKQK